jgi:hypothetical protein
MKWKLGLDGFSNTGKFQVKEFRDVADSFLCFGEDRSIRTGSHRIKFSRRLDCFCTCIRMLVCEVLVKKNLKVIQKKN